MIEKEKYKYRDIPPRSSVSLHTYYYEWEFDWSNQINIFIKTRETEKRIAFYLEKYYVGYNSKTDNIPIMNRPGWICRETGR